MLIYKDDRRLRGGMPLTGAVIVLLLVLPLLLLADSSTDVSLYDLKGQPHRVSEYLGTGKWTIVNVWGPRCPACQLELPELVRFHEEHHQFDATVLGIALDYPGFGDPDADEVAAFADEYRVSYPVLLGTAAAVDNLGAGPLLAMPTTLAFTPEGDLVGAQVGVISREIIERFIRDYTPD